MGRHICEMIMQVSLGVLAVNRNHADQKGCAHHIDRER